MVSGLSFDIDLVWLVVLAVVIVMGYAELKFKARQQEKDISRIEAALDATNKKADDFEGKIFSLLTELKMEVSNILGRMSKD